jgi:hypothetical protein
MSLFVGTVRSVIGERFAYAEKSFRMVNLSAADESGCTTPPSDAQEISTGHLTEMDWFSDPAAPHLRQHHGPRPYRVMTCDPELARWHAGEIHVADIVFGRIQERQHTR